MVKLRVTSGQRGVFALCLAVHRTGVSYVVCVSLKPDGLKNVEKAVVRVLGSFRNVVKLSRFRSKVFRI
jgi:hypothetical protein